MSSGGMRGQRGVAFVLVLWLLALLTMLLGGFALITRTEALQARHLFDTTTARYAAEAGVNQAVHALSLPDPEVRWIPDGRDYSFQFDDAEVVVAITDESGLIDLNASDALTLTNLFVAFGVELDAALSLADAILDWRDGDDLALPNGAEDGEYEGAGYPYGAKDGPFDTVGELQQVMGMSYQLFRQVEPALTIYSGQAIPNLAFAPVEVIRALPNMDDALARQIVEQRHAYSPADGGVPPILPDGTPLVAEGGTGTYSIVSRATLPNGAWTELHATIRLGGAGLSGLAYSVLRWQDGAPVSTPDTPDS